MEVVYIISTKEKSAENIFKPGKHTGTLRKLESRYVTSLVNPIVYFYYPTKYASLIEAEIKKQLDAQRIINDNGTKTEWVKTELRTITDIIHDTEALLQKKPFSYKLSINKSETVDLNYSHRTDCQYQYSIYYKEQTICEILILHEKNETDELAIDHIKVLPQFDDDNYIGSIVSILSDHLDKCYSSVNSYIIAMGSIQYMDNNKTKPNRYSDSEEVSDEEIIEDKTDNLQKTFEKQLLNKYDRYHCYQITKRNNNYIILSKPKNTMENTKFKKGNVCDISLKFTNNVIFYHNYVNEELPYMDQLVHKGGSKMMNCRRKFSVNRSTKNGEPDSDFKYTLITIVFDKPLVFISDVVPDDIYMKFIVGEKDYTSKTGEISKFSFDYRYNKLCGDLSTSAYLGSHNINKHIYTINGFSYYEEKVDYINCHYSTKEFRNRVSRIDSYYLNEIPYPQLCTMVKKIYNDCK